VLLALSGGQKAGILLVAAVFIAFAVASSFFFPRRDPDFPRTTGLRWFIVVTIVLFVSMMGAIVLLAKEDEEEGGHEAAATETAPGDTQAEPPTETEPPAGNTEPEGQGDPAAGEQVYASAGCGGCHTLEAAGSAGTVGPNLDQAKPDQALVVDRVTNGKGVMPSFEAQLSEEEIQNVAAFVVASTQG
jgi:mono/diheme cytochrome c family protein